jgi:hypothetical protein
MLDQELKNIWKNANQQELVKFEQSKLMIEMNQQLKKFNKSIKTRDRLEIVAAVIIIPFFVCYAIFIPFILTKIASLLIVLWAVFVIYKLRSIKKYKPVSLHLNCREYIVKQRAYLIKQMNLVDSALYWYILPFVLLFILFIIGLPVEWSWDLPFCNKNSIWEIVFMVLVFPISVLHMNKQAVKKQFKPLIKQLDETLNNLEE